MKFSIRIQILVVKRITSYTGIRAVIFSRGPQVYIEMLESIILYVYYLNITKLGLATINKLLPLLLSCQYSIIVICFSIYF